MGKLPGVSLISMNALSWAANTKNTSTAMNRGGRDSVIEITQVWERLFLGGRYDAERLYRLNPHGITSVVSICEDAVLRRNPRIAYVHIAVADATPMSVGKFDAIIDAIAGNIRWGRLLVNCGAGVSRTPIMVAAWMHVVGYKNIDAALVEIRKLRPMVSPSPILLKSIKEHLR